MFGAMRRLPACLAMLAISTGAPITVAAIYETREGWRCVLSPLPEVPRDWLTGAPTRRRSRRRSRARSNERSRPRLRTGTVRARLARAWTWGPAVRVALACPYAWDDPGGVQVQVRELAERLRDGGHEVLALAPARTAPTEPWVRAVGRPLDIPYNASNAPIDPRPWSRAAVRHALAGFGPDVVHAHQPTAPSTGLWATLRPARPWWARSIRGRGARASTTWPRPSSVG